MKNLLNINFWINPRPEALIPVFQKIFIGAIVVFGILAVVFLLIEKKGMRKGYSAVWQSAYKFLFVNCGVGLLLLFFNYEKATFLSARGWFLIWGAGMLVWLFFIGKKIFGVPDRIREIERQKEFKKYIP